MSSIEENFYGFVDAMDRKGVPLGRLVIALRNKGIPPLPAFLLIVALLAFGIASLVAPMLAPAQLKGTVYISVLSEGGLPIENAKVTAAMIESNYFVSAMTDAKGIAKITDVPVGELTLSASLGTAQSKIEKLTVDADKTKYSTIYLAGRSISTPKLTINAIDATTKTPIPATVVITFENGTEITRDEASLGTIDFLLDSNSKYSVKVLAPGYSDGEKIYLMGSSDDSIEIPLVPRALSNKMPLYVKAEDNAGNNLPDIKISVFDGDSNEVIASEYTGSSGTINKVEVPVGKSYYVIARDLTGKYLQAKSERYVASTPDDVRITLTLTPARTDNSAEIIFTVVNAQTDGPVDANVVLYEEGRQIDSRKAINGMVRFKTGIEKVYTATIYASGFLPQVIENVWAPYDERIELQPSFGNSGKVKVKVLDTTGYGVSGAKVVLLDENGVQLGLPAATTAIDGVTDVISDVPLANIYAYAAIKSRNGTSEMELVSIEGNSFEDNITYIELSLSEPKAKVRVFATNYLTKQGIFGANVRVFDRISGAELGTCKTSSEGLCEVEVKPVDVYVEVSSVEYKSGTSDYQTLQEGSTASFRVPLYPLSMGLTVQLDGIYDMKGKRVQTLIPSEKYRAVFRLIMPNINADEASVFLRVGKENVNVDDDVIGIVNIDATGYSTIAKGATYTPPTGTDEDLNSTSANGMFKWVRINYPSGKKGVTTISTIIKISPNVQEEEKIDIHYGGYYRFGNEYFRFPEDNEVQPIITENSTKHPMYANSKVESFSVSTDNTYCTDTMCYQLYFIDDKGSRIPSGGFDIEANKDFKVHFKLSYTSQKRPVVSLKTDSNSVEFKSVQLTSPNRATATPRIDATGQTLTISLTQLTDVVEGDFLLTSKIHDKAIPLSFSATDASETEINMGVSGVGALKVNISTQKVYAASRNSFTVKVTDAKNVPITDARVTIAGASDPDPFDGMTYDELGDGESIGKDGVYSFVGVEPYGVGAIRITAERIGYKPSSLLLNLTANELISVDVKSIIMSLAGEEKEFQQYFVLKNKLINTINTTVGIKINGKALTTCDAITCSSCLNLTCLDSTFVDYLEPEEEFELAAIAKKNPNVMSVIAGSSNRVNSETLDGSIVINARIGKYIHNLTVPVKINHNFIFKGFDNEWTILEKGLEFWVTDSVNGMTDTDYLNIENRLLFDSPYAYHLQANYVLSPSLTGYVNATPTESLLVGPSTTHQWALIAQPGSEVMTGWGCIEKESTKSGNIVITAGPLNKTGDLAYTSSRTIPITIYYEPSGECAGGWGVATSNQTVSLTELSRSANLSICVKNMGPESIKVTTVLSDPFGLVNTEKMKFTGKTFSSPDGDIISPGIECATLNVPIEINSSSSLLDIHGCINDSRIRTVNITLNAKGTTTSFSSQQKLTLSVMPQPSDDCPWKKAQITQELFSGVTISAATDMAPNGVFNFKKGTSNDFRFMAIANNYDESVQLSMSCTGRSLNCIDVLSTTTPKAGLSTSASYEMGAGKSAIFNCTTTGTATTGTCSVSIKGKNSTTGSYSISLGNKTISLSLENCPECTGTPLGLLAPPSGSLERETVVNTTASTQAQSTYSNIMNAFGTTESTTVEVSTTGQLLPAPEDILRCTRYFCNSDQAALSILKATEVIAAKIVEWRDDPANANMAVVKTFCEGRTDKKLRKTIIVQMANTRFQNALFEDVGPLQTSALRGADLRGCGVYTITIEGELGCGVIETDDPNEWIKSVRIVVRPDIITGAKCDVALHNAALLMPYEVAEDNLRVHVGLGSGTSTLHFLRFFKENATNTVDVELANTTQDILYGETLRFGEINNTILKSHSAFDFDNPYSDLTSILFGVFTSVFFAHCGLEETSYTGLGYGQCIAQRLGMYYSCIGVQAGAMSQSELGTATQFIALGSGALSLGLAFAGKISGPFSWPILLAMAVPAGIGAFAAYEAAAKGAPPAFAPAICNCFGSTFLAVLLADPTTGFTWKGPGIAAAIAAGLSLYDMSQQEVGWEWIPLVGPVFVAAQQGAISGSAAESVRVATQQANAQTAGTSQLAPPPVVLPQNANVIATGSKITWVNPTTNAQYQAVFDGNNWNIGRVGSQNIFPTTPGNMNNYLGQATKVDPNSIKIQQPGVSPAISVKPNQLNLANNQFSTVGAQQASAQVPITPQYAGLKVTQYQAQPGDRIVISGSGVTDGEYYYRTALPNTPGDKSGWVHYDPVNKVGYDSKSPQQVLKGVSNDPNVKIKIQSKLPNGGYVDTVDDNIANLKFSSNNKGIVNIQSNQPTGINMQNGVGTVNNKGQIVVNNKVVATPPKGQQYSQVTNNQGQKQWVLLDSKTKQPIAQQPGAQQQVPPQQTTGGTTQQVVDTQQKATSRYKTIKRSDAAKDAGTGPSKRATIGGQIVKGFLAAWAGGQIANILLDCDFNDPQVLLTQADLYTSMGTAMNHIVVSHDFANTMKIVTPSVRWVTYHNYTSTDNSTVTKTKGINPTVTINNVYITFEKLLGDGNDGNQGYLLWVHSPDENQVTITTVLNKLFG